MTTKTAERLHAMSLQEIFDFVNEAIIKQGVPSYDSELGDCAYRGPNGLKCAAGMLLDDADYDKEYEGWGVLELCKKIGFRVGNEMVDCDLAETITRKRDLIDRLQGAHDSAARVLRDAIHPSPFLQVYKEKMEHVQKWLNSLPQSN